MQNLLLGHKLLFLWFLLGYLFLLCSLPSWFGNSLLFFNKDHLSVQGELICELNLTMNCVNSAPHLGGFVHLDVLNGQRICI